MSALNRFFEQTSMLPPAPRVVGELLNKFDDPTVDIKTISLLLGHDQVLVAKVLRMANSSFYGVSGTIGSVDDAVTLLGLVQVQVIVITCGVAAGFSKIKGLALGQYWRTNLLAGLIARELATSAGEEPNVAFTAGLMHSIGQPLIHLGFPQAGTELERSTEQGDFQQRLAAEREVLGTDHCQIGAELARRWNFPPAIVDAIAHYADPGGSGATSLSRVVFVAARIAHLVGRGDEVESVLAQVAPEAPELTIDAEVLVRQIDAFRQLASGVANAL